MRSFCCEVKLSAIPAPAIKLLNELLCILDSSAILDLPCQAADGTGYHSGFTHFSFQSISLCNVYLGILKLGAHL